MPTQDVSVPDVPGPEAPVADLPAGDAEMPDGSVPDVVVAHGSVPDPSVPDGSVPHGSVRQGSVPGVVVPGGSADGAPRPTEPAGRAVAGMPDTRIIPARVDDGLPSHFRRVVSFHPRGGRLNAVQRKAFETHADHWYLEAAELKDPIDVATLFSRRADPVLEIGSGMGESTVGMAAARPEINLLAVEVYKPGVAQTLHHLSRANLHNVRVLRGDGVQVLTDLIAPGSLAEVWLFFPDPWPKTKHLKRRLVTPDFAALVTSRLRRGGVFRLATDWAPYAESMLAACTATKGLRNAHPGWAPRPPFRPKTRFERRGLAAGHEIFDLEFVRR